MIPTRALATLVGIALIAGCTNNAAPTRVPDGPAETPTAVQTPAVELPTATEARSQLEQLRRVDRNPDTLPPYERDAFGEAWADIDGNGCNQRDDVLLRDAVPGTTRVQQQGSCDHDVLAGIWVDPYTGRTLTFDDLKDLSQAQAIQIDHVVPLAEAWRSGASGWRDRRREGYANDLANLLAADGPTNAAKSDDDPAAWRPKQTYQCQYATRWIAVKHRWKLGADASEVAALADMLGTCPTSGG